MKRINIRLMNGESFEVQNWKFGNIGWIDLMLLGDRKEDTQMRVIRIKEINILWIDEITTI